LPATDERKAVVPVINIKQMIEWRNAFVEFAKSILKDGVDFGTYAGIEKPSLYKAGAEKLRTAFGLQVKMELTNKIEDFETPYLDYTYKCTIYNREGNSLGECEGNTNSAETKYKYVWQTTSKKPDKAKAEELKNAGLGRWKKDRDNWVWCERKENREILGLKNTIMKMAQKRAFVGAILISTGASEFFTCDIEDMEFTPVKENVENSKMKAGVSPTPDGFSEEAIDKCKTMDELEKLYKDNETAIKTSKKLLALVNKKKKSLEVPVKNAKNEYLPNKNSKTKAGIFDLDSIYQQFADRISDCFTAEMLVKTVEEIKSDNNYKILTDEYVEALNELIKTATSELIDDDDSGLGG